MMMKREAGAQKVSKIIMCMKFWVIFLFLFVRAAGGVSRLKRYETDGLTRSCAGLPDKLDFDHKLTLTYSEVFSTFSSYMCYYLKKDLH